MVPMNRFESATGSTTIDSGHWADRRAMNRDHSIFHQWERCEASGTIDNFRIAARLKEGPRRGFFYSDSDLHKWADAAARILRSIHSPGRGPSLRLEALLDEYIALMTGAQEADGYLFTYNQIHFPGTRWKNLMIEHELYCLGHFIEAGVSHFEASGGRALLDLAMRAADLVVREFREAPAWRTSGHEEIEIALLRLFRLTRRSEYLDTARALLERRGRIPFFGARLLAQVASQAWRSRKIAVAGAALKVAVGQATDGQAVAALGFEFGGNLGKREPPLLGLRALPVFLDGAYQQQDRPLRAQREPRGHAVRWAYLMTAAAMLRADTGDESLGAAMDTAWLKLVDAKMYVTGGLGSLPIIEGFGRPFELDNGYAYAETCAAIGSVLWNRELSLAHGDDARHADLTEWQLHNAVAVGVSVTGDRYFYRNLLSSDGGIERRPWYPTACCPSNISRLWAELDRMVLSVAEGVVRVEQYISSTTRLGDGTVVAIESGFPWSGAVSITVDAPRPTRLLFRVPGWAARCRVALDGRDERLIERVPVPVFGAARFTAATYEELALPGGKSHVRLEFDMAVSALRAHPKVRCDRGRVALVRGPLVYCAEAVDNPGIDLESVAVDPTALRAEGDPSFLGGGCVAIVGTDSRGRALRLVPYHLWGNRDDRANEARAMRVFLKESAKEIT